MPRKPRVVKKREEKSAAPAQQKSSGKKKLSGRKTRGKVAEFKERKYSWESDSDDLLGSEGGSEDESGSEEEADCELKKKINQAMKSDSEENFF